MDGKICSLSAPDENLISIVCLFFIFLDSLASKERSQLWLQFDFELNKI
jgi:hypothetical protein